MATVVEVVNILVGCTDRKKHPVGDGLRVRTLRATISHERSKEWISRLQDEPAIPTPARDLYAGDHWSVVRSIIEQQALPSLEVKTWVCSAGYGLVGADFPLKPYAATFASGHPDCVTNGIGPRALRSARDRWWRQLSEWKGPVPGAPRTLAEVASANPSASLLVALSPAYLDAVLPDLTEAVKCLSHPDLMCIFSSGSRLPITLETHFIRCDARLQHVLKGPRQSLHARVLRKALQECDRTPLNVPALRIRFERLQAEQQPIPTYSRAPITDDQVKDFVRKHLERDAMVSHSRLLRTLRDSGQACEQSRFARLFKDVRDRDAQSR